MSLLKRELNRRERWAGYIGQPMYYEADVKFLMKLSVKKALEWAAENVKNINDNIYDGIDKNSILEGEFSDKLDI